MSDRKIKVTIDALGKPVVEASGYAGCGCTEATKGIEQALGGSGDGSNRVLKGEYNEISTDSEQSVEQRW